MVAPSEGRLVLVQGEREVPVAPLPAEVKVSVVIPTLNEARNLPHVFARLPEGLHELIVVDGRSTDDTVAVRDGCTRASGSSTRPERARATPLHTALRPARGT